MALQVASSSSSSSSSCVPLPPIKYDVFISFRGEDTRRKFTSHLHDALCRKNIKTYIDDRLSKGDKLSSALIQAIEESYISIVVLSENFASSKWCLDELTHILHCKRNHGQIVIPVFYEVEPTHVRHQTRNYEEAFKKHEGDLNLKVPRWREALNEVANLAGWNSLTWRDDSELVQKIVKDVLQRLSRRYPPSKLKGLVAIDKNCGHIELLLREVETVGIWGMGGIGKTTIARALFLKHCSEYEGSCFLKNIRENSGEHAGGLDDLRCNLFSQLLKEDLSIGSPTSFAEYRLSRMRVFIVLDDVSTLEQLEYLAGQPHYFGAGSKILITTRDKHVLCRGVNAIYKVQELNSQESLFLFSLKAFNQNLPKLGYEELSKRAVTYAKGIPLALKVLGSFLCKKSENEWNSALRKLKRIPHEGIQKVLKLSYDGLDREEKNIFLDIACFLKGMVKEDMIALLDGFGFDAAIGIKSLQDKALIKGKDRMPIEMHDLLQEMGREIHVESINEPERRSRLWDSEEIYDILMNDKVRLLWDSKEIYDILMNNKGTEKVKGIMLNMRLKKNLCLSADTFGKMTSLKFLKLYFYPEWTRLSHLSFPQGLKLLPNKLTYLEWHGYPLKTLPAAFCPSKLVMLHLPESKVQKLWDGVQDLVNLKEINLRGSVKLMELPDLSKASNLERVDLSKCENLLSIHPSILSLHSLVNLNLWSCKKLKSLQSETHLRSLKRIELRFCSNLMHFSISSEELQELDLQYTGVKFLGPSTGRSSRLKKLYLSDVIHLPNELSCLRSLTELQLSNCIIDYWQLHDLFDGLRSLRHVLFSNCSSIIELPDNIQHLLSLEILQLQNCKMLRSLPKLPPFVRYLHANHCTSLKKVFSSTPMLQNDPIYILFVDCINLDEQSLHYINEDARHSMTQYACEIARRRISTEDINYNMYGSSMACFPGSKVPEWFRYQTREASSSINVDFLPCSQLLGFIFCVVLDSCYFGREKSEVEVKCKMFLGNLIEVGRLHVSSTGTIELKSDHVYLWYRPWDCYKILKQIDLTRGNDQFITDVKFEFNVQTLKSVPNQKDLGIKECGIFPIYFSETSGVHSAYGIERTSEDVDQKQSLPRFKKLSQSIMLVMNWRLFS